jgi:hypothetical protein
LSFHTSRIPVGTASAVQVRSPIHTQSVGKWRFHRQRLVPLIRQLEAEGHHGGLGDY